MLIVFEGIDINEDQRYRIHSHVRNVGKRSSPVELGQMELTGLLREGNA